MSKAEKFIQEHTKNTYNYNSYEPSATPWLTPNEARNAVEIAREEMIEWLKDNANKYIINTTPSYPDADFSAIIGDMCWKDLEFSQKDMK